jgi:hypothetical protein
MVKSKISVERIPSQHGDEVNIAQPVSVAAQDQARRVLRSGKSSAIPPSVVKTSKVPRSKGKSMLPNRFQSWSCCIASSYL